MMSLFVSYRLRTAELKKTKLTDHSLTGMAKHPLHCLVVRITYNIDCIASVHCYLDCFLPLYYRHLRRVLEFLRSRHRSTIRTNEQLMKIISSDPGKCIKKSSRR